jgi:hypothetical protein
MPLMRSQTDNINQTITKVKSHITLKNGIRFQYQNYIIISHHI